MFILSLHILTLTRNRDGNAEISSERLCFALMAEIFQAQQEGKILKTLQRNLEDKAKTHFFLRGTLWFNS